MGMCLYAFLVFQLHYPFTWSDKGKFNLQKQLRDKVYKIMEYIARKISAVSWGYS